MEEQNRIHARVRALLAKAESTDFAEEAAVYTAKAQELITRYAIDRAVLEEVEGRGQITTRLIEVPSPYPKEKFVLLGGIARANNCRAILGIEHKVLYQMVEDKSLFDLRGRVSTVVGYESDLDAVEMLFTSLLIQAVNEVMAHGTQITEWGENRTRSFRRSFLYQFAWTVRERLAEVTEVARKDAADQKPSLLPVLADREAAVLSVVDERFPGTSPLRSSVTNVEGVVAGEAAGRRADIGSQRLRPGQRTLSP